MVIGYIIGIILIPKILSQKNLLAWSAISGLVFTGFALFIPASSVLHFPFIDLMTFQKVEIIIPYTVLFVALLGVSNAIVWPAVWPLAIHGLGKFIKTGSALLIMGIAGGALLPLIWGSLAEVWSPQQAYWIAVPCYLFILYFGLAGYKVKRWS
jgi:fucose permease